MYSLKLPMLIKPHNHKKALLYTFIYFIGFYLFANHIHLTPPELLPLFPFEKSLTFIPWTWWIYLSAYPGILSAGFFVNKDEDRNKMVYGFLILVTISCIIFLLYPTTYPRSDFHVSGDVHWTTLLAIDAFRSIDSPANCLPSLHVSGCFFVSFFLYMMRQRKAFIYFVWATLVAISTVTTKQHYLWDVLSGLSLGLLLSWFSINKIVIVKSMT